MGPTIHVAFRRLLLLAKNSELNTGYSNTLFIVQWENLYLHMMFTKVLVSMFVCLPSQILAIFTRFAFGCYVCTPSSWDYKNNLAST